ncbi:uncharacterized protein LOC102076495 isoform X5 [Oreochromis niloticus]|uniref:uncharacterized protein LOC102076495 isoform X5 n=1 Tax=Oreochromis niloticus TaxID=8128 RepID=UPI0009047189|nr:uncharacterized protein LOC102076495 isoform X5 [Oreochromis niloticus]
MNDPIKTVAPALHPIKVHLKVKEPWEVLGMDLIGPLPETRLGNRYVLTMTDLFTKWVIAEPLKSKTAAEVSAIMTSKLYTFGMVRKIITDQGKEFVNQLNNSIFSTLNIKHAVSSAYHPQTNGQVLRNFERAQDTQRKTFEPGKRKQVRECVVQAGDDVLLSGDPKRRRTGDALLSQHQGLYTVASITPKGVATIVKGATCQKVNVSRLRNYHRSKNPPTERKFLLDHSYGTPERQIDHQYASPGAKWQKDLEPLQSSLGLYSGPKPNRLEPQLDIGP